MTHVAAPISARARSNGSELLLESSIRLEVLEGEVEVTQPTDYVGQIGGDAGQQFGPVRSLRRDLVGVSWSRPAAWTR